MTDEETTRPGNIASQAVDATRLEKAVRLRARGAHWNEIAATCGYSSPAEALRAVGRAMEASVARAEATVDQYRDEAEFRLGMLLREALELLDTDAPISYDKDGNPEVSDDRAVKLRAIDEARRIVGDMNKLRGVDKPPAGDPGDDTLKIQIVGLDPRDLV